MVNTAGAIFEGTIILWSGSIVSIPTGWFLCDGNNSTPDLTDNFIVGAGDTFDPDDSGGSLTHPHTATGAAHSHSWSMTGSSKRRPETGNGKSLSTFTDGAIAFTTASSSNLPPYYALAFIYNPTIPQGAFPGSIVLWSGSVGNIPSGWNLCDGNNSTVDLENKFVIGAGDTYAVGDNGTGSHVHVSAGGTGHVHIFPDSEETMMIGTGVGATTNSRAYSYTTDSALALPKYYALAYIQNTTSDTLGIFTGMVLYWSGSVVSIPTGFTLCDGTSSTPDLTDKFVVGAGDTYSVDATTETMHLHTGTSNGHTHTSNVAAGFQSGGTLFRGITDSKTAVLDIDANTTQPPFYALAYMMKT